MCLLIKVKQNQNNFQLFPVLVTGTLYVSQLSARLQQAVPLASAQAGTEQAEAVPFTGGHPGNCVLPEQLAPRLVLTWHPWSAEQINSR